MNEDKRCQPILFHSDGNEVDEQVRFLNQIFVYFVILVVELVGYLTHKFFPDYPRTSAFKQF